MTSIIILVLSALTGSEEDLTSTLKEHGVIVVGSNLTTDGEKEFRTQMARSARESRTVRDAANRYFTGERQRAEIERQVALLTQANFQLNANLATLNPNNVAGNNRLVGAINANVARIALLRGQSANAARQIDKLRKEATQARESFIQYVIDSRKLADEIEKRRSDASKNDDVKKALKELNADGGDFSLKEPSQLFRTAVKRLEGVESRVLSEQIPLRRSPGGTAEVSVTINGEKAVDMVLDSGASLVVLPAKVASQLKIKPGPKDPPILLVLADGSEITGTLVKVETVRIGQFVVEDVECAVLGPEAIRAEPCWE